jgi:hypothetical protein
MSTNLPTREPQVFTAGDTLSFVRQVSDYPASAGWTLSYVLRGPTTIKSNATTYATSDYLISESAANTANWTAGLYSMQAYVTNSGGYRYAVDTWFPKITIKPDPAKYVEGSASNLTFAQRTLLAVETAIESLSSKKVATASVNGQSYSIQNLASLTALRQRMREEVRSEEDAINYAAGLGVSKNVLVRFPPIAYQGWVTQEGVPPVQ